MSNKIDIIDVAHLYRKLELIDIENIYIALVLSIKTYKNDIVFEPSADDKLIIWATIIGAAIFPLMNSKADDKVVNQAIKLWPYMFSEKLDIDLDLLANTLDTFISKLVEFKMGDDITYWLRKELRVGENDKDFSSKLNNLALGNQEFWPAVFRQHGLPVSIEE